MLTWLAQVAQAHSAGLPHHPGQRVAAGLVLIAMLIAIVIVSLRNKG